MKTIMRLVISVAVWQRPSASMFRQAAPLRATLGAPCYCLAKATWYGTAIIVPLRNADPM